MAVAFTNNWDNVLTKLENILKTEFEGSLNIYRSLNNVHEGNQYLRISPISSELIDYSGSLETREFTIDLFLYFKILNVKKTDTDQVMRFLSRLETIIGNNMTMTLSDSSQAYNCRIESTEIDTSNPEEYLINLSYKCLHQNSSLQPAVTISAAEVSDGASSIDSTLSLTFTTNLPTNDFVVGDISVTNGVLSSFSGSGTTYTATFTPSSLGATTIKVLANKFTSGDSSNEASDIFNWTAQSAIRSIELNGTDEYIGFGDIDEVEAIGAISFSFWIKIKDVTENHEIITKGRYFNSAASWSITYSGGDKRMQFSVKNNFFSFEDLDDLANNTWYHFGITYSNASDSMAMYLNGSALTLDHIQTGGYVDVPNTTKEVKIGVGDQNLYGNFFIMQVGVWTEYLTASEIAVIYNAGQNSPLDLTSNSGDYTSSSGLECFWKFNETSGSGVDAVADSSGNGHSGRTYNTDDTNWVSG